jgi:hypothetical protein
VEQYRAQLRDRPVASSKMVRAGTLQGRVTECTLIASVWVNADDRRTHTRLVVELDAQGYRG